MAYFIKNAVLVDSADVQGTERDLQEMVTNRTYNTTSSYTPNTTKYPDGRLPFVDKHMNYLHAHPALDRDMYIANLRLMTRIN